MLTSPRYRWSSAVRVVAAACLSVTLILAQHGCTTTPSSHCPAPDVGEACALPCSEGTRAEDFDRLYAQWEADVDRASQDMAAEAIASGEMPEPFISNSLLYDHDSFRDIVDLGVGALPAILQKLPEDEHIEEALFRITKWRYTMRREGPPRAFVRHIEELPDVRAEGGFPETRTIWNTWWTEAPKLTPGLFDERHTAWRAAVDSGDDSLAEESWLRLKNVGVAALPQVVKKAEQGDADLLPLLSYLTDGAVAEAAAGDLTPAHAIAWWRENGAKWSIPFDKYDPDDGDS